ncbi:unnamed protein product [Ilex paraguariensis]|uniref:Nucleoside diphosphate kinase-like domain-containing protein n=1 Tax=Ilex paraguariensis TaxID=185542 RepID=A0ABC8UFS8_9AQUA
MLQMTPRWIRNFDIFLLFFLLVAAFFVRHSSGDVITEKASTLAMIKPDGVAGNYTNVIKQIISESGFRITREMMVQLDEDTVTSFYAEHSSKSFFPSLVKYMTSGSILIMVLEKVNAVADWRALIGPTDARKAKVTHPHRLFIYSLSSVVLSFESLLFNF